MCPRGFPKHEIVGEALAAFTEAFVGRRACSWDEQNLILKTSLLSFKVLVLELLLSHSLADFWVSDSALVYTDLI